MITYFIISFIIFLISYGITIKKTDEFTEEEFTFYIFIFSLFWVITIPLLILYFIFTLIIKTKIYNRIIDSIIKIINL